MVGLSSLTVKMEAIFSSEQPATRLSTQFQEVGTVKEKH